MVRKFCDIHFAIFTAVVFAFATNEHCFAQVQSRASVDTPFQRWLPPPNNAYPNQQGGQAKLLTHLRNSLLQKEGSVESNPARLSESDVRAFKKAMKQFEDQFPEGLTADSLDAIPSDLISKALSNPELVRQAQELAHRDPKKNDFADLMDKLRSTQKQFEKGQSQSQEPTQSNNTQSRGIEDPRKRKEVSDQQSSKPSTDTPSARQPPQGRTESQQFGSPKYDSRLEVPESNSTGSTTADESRPQSNSKPADNLPTTNLAKDRNSSGRASTQSKSEGSSVVTRDDSSALDSDRMETPKQSDKATGAASDSRGLSQTDSTNQNSMAIPRNRSQMENTDIQPATSLDIRNELDRRGFLPTIQRIAEEAQRTSLSSRIQSTPKTTTDSNENTVNKPPSKRPAVTSPRTTETIPRPTKTDSAFSKSMQQTSKYLNKLWTEATKSSSTNPRTSLTISPKLQSKPSLSSASRTASLEPNAIPNPFNVRVLESLFVLATVGVVAYLAMRFRFQSEREKKIALAAEIATKIDEIQTGDDVVRAFHALAKQRLDSAQAWWTCGYVTERFVDTLPEHTRPIRTLSELYDQARYYPTEHQLTTDQIEYAKFALKQCEG